MRNLEGFGDTVMAYSFTFWMSYVLLKEHEKVASMRLHFLATEKRRPDQFTVLTRNIPPDPDESMSELVEHFFLVNHPDRYLTHQVVYDANKLAKLVKKKKKLQNWLVYHENKYERNPSKRPETKTGFLGLWAKKVDAINYHGTEIDKLSKEIAIERDKVTNDPKSIITSAFIQNSMGYCCLCTDSTNQKPNRMADRVGSGAARCILAELGNSICLSHYLGVNHSFCILFPHFLFYDPHCIWYNHLQVLRESRKQLHG